ncbi:radical SAM protein [Methanothrix sp.]|jgi:uncharacterized protein|uniref:radical SAM protein n=1 Tax=Methanothrix sp. TaxID=90426 RepID=UPI003BB52F97
MIEFKSFGDNIYAWDEEIGLFIPYSADMRAVMDELLNTNSVTKEEIIEKFKGDFKEEDIAFCYDWAHKWKKIRSQDNDKLRDNLYDELSESSVKTYLLKYGLGQLTLNVTEDCNFRCKYCAYNPGNYEYNRSYSNKYMEFSVAKKAIDYYFSLLLEGRRYNPIRAPAISFFGGEPLLNFNLIKKCVNYINDRYKDDKVLYYGVTTNGTLLDDEKINWLIQNNFDIDISLDGPKDEHDRNRVYKNGKGTFKDVMRNVTKLIDAKYEHVKIISIFDWKSDLSKLDNFFSRKDIPPLSLLGAVSNVKGCNYYNRFSVEDHNAFIRQMDRAKVKYLEEYSKLDEQLEKKSVFHKLFKEGPVKIINGASPAFSKPLSIMPFTGACIPGSRIFVDVKGDFHICEKVIETNPIGNVDKGLDFGKIKKFLSEYMHHMDKCPSCKLRRACPYCYIHFMNDKGFSYSSEICKNVESFQSNYFTMAFSLGEKDPEYIKNSANY